MAGTPSDNLSRTGQHQGAIITLKKAIELDNRHFGAWRALAVTYRRLGDTAKATETMQEMLKLEPPDKYRTWAEGALDDT